MGILRAAAAALFFLASPAAAAEIPSLEWKALSDTDITPVGKAALSYKKGEWKHAETKHFVYHYTDAREAETVYVHAEIYYGWVKDIFGVSEDRWKKKAHIFVFQDPEDWTDFLAKNRPGMEASAFTNGFELFIRRDPFYLAPMRILAHEITHVIVFRFLDGPIPLFLNEGFAEFISYRALAMQAGKSEFDMRTLQLISQQDFIPLERLAEMKDYPQGKIDTFYRESEWLVRTLILKHDQSLFYALLMDVSGGKRFEDSLRQRYGNEMEAFAADFQKAITKPA
jgi:hypothetical protein